MKANQIVLAGERTQEKAITCFAFYKGHSIDLEQCGHPQAQNVLIDGENVGYVVFPQSGLDVARGIIDQRIEAIAQV